MPGSAKNKRKDAGTIVVNGIGRIAIAPDLADLRLGVAVTKPKVDAARSEAAATMEKILAAIAAAGVARTDIRTSQLSIQPRLEYREGKPPKVDGYELSNVVDVTIRDLGRIGGLIDAAIGAGATSMDSLSFRLADPLPVETRARQAAMADARARADVLAAAGGLSIEGVSDIVEGAIGRPPIPYAKAERMMLAADAGTPVEAGSLEVVVNVTVTYRAT